MAKKNTVDNEDSGWNLFYWLLYVIKKNLVLILSLIILSAGIGTGYAIVRKYEYTASCQISYTAKNLAYDYTTYNVSVMSAYLMTVVDFCDEGVVVDRANYYYDCFLKAKEEDPDLKASDYVEETLKINDDYSKDKEVETQYIDATKIISESGETDDNAVRFTFTVKYTDISGQDANDKLTFIVFAASKEINEIGEDPEDGSVYFAGLRINLQYISNPSSTPSVSKKKIVISAVLIGLVLALAIACIRELLDDTVKDEEELYKITNVETLSFIYDIEGGSSNV